MNDTQRRQHDRFNRVRSFCNTLTDPLEPGTHAGRALAAITAAINECEELDASQSTHKREAQQGTNRRKEARERLRAQLSVISTTARTIAMEHPEFKDKFKLAGSRDNDQALLSTAQAFLTEITPPNKLLFHEYDMPVDFLETLNTNINDFEQAVNRQNMGATRRTRAKTGIDEAQGRAATELEKLDTIIRNRFRDDEAMLAAWENASRVERAPRGATKNGNSQGDNAPPTP